jgi:CDP-diacylglycerol--glycerol-3-phosphate 3-phosphatidyltransferase
MTWANAVTLARLALTPLLIFAFLSGPAWLFFALFVLIMLGDLLDGALARWQGQITELGKALDPLVDKILFASLFIALAIKEFIAWEIVILIAIPQIALLIGGAVLFQRWKLIVGARWSGKIATLVLALGLLALLIRAKLEIEELTWAYEIIYVGIFLSYAAGLDYLLNALRLVRR